MAEQGQLEVVPLGPLFEPENELTPRGSPMTDLKKLDHDPSRPIALTGRKQELRADQPDVSY